MELRPSPRELTGPHVDVDLVAVPGGNAKGELRPMAADQQRDMRALHSVGMAHRTVGPCIGTLEAQRLPPFRSKVADNGKMFLQQLQSLREGRERHAHPACLSFA